MLRAKLFWKKHKEELRILIAALILAAILLAVRRSDGLFTNLSDFFFLVGTVHLVAGGARYIRNVGLFKTFSYTAYRRRWKHSGQKSGELHPMTLAEFTERVIYDEMRQKEVKWPLLSGCICWVISFLAACAA